ncbi:uncharacterized protein JCM10292_003782 [Rhodotorula paludigena]|uniref:uncharacterized protein n=1 Tax=Rhodotorula paludigena TaxID=86838 RepID=UPI003181C757
MAPRRAGNARPISALVDSAYASSLSPAHSKGPVATGKASLLHYFSSSPAVASSSAQSSQAASSSPIKAPAAAMLGRTRSEGADDLAAASGQDRTPRAKALRGTQSLSAVHEVLASTRTNAATRSRTASASSQSSLLSPPLQPVSGPSGVRRSPRSKLQPLRDEGEAGEPDRARVKAESMSPSKQTDRYPLRSPPVRREESSARSGKGKAREIEIPDSSSEADGPAVGPSASSSSRASAWALRDSASPRRNPRRAGHNDVKKDYKVSIRLDGTQEMNLTRSSSSPSGLSRTASPPSRRRRAKVIDLQNIDEDSDDSDDDSEIIIIQPLPKAGRARSGSGTATPRAVPPAAAPSPARGSPLIKREVLSSAAPSSPGLARRKSPGPQTSAQKVVSEVKAMPPPASPLSKTTALGPSTPTRASGSRSAGKQGARARSISSAGLAPVVELPHSPRSRVTALASPSTTPRVAITGASSSPRATAGAVQHANASPSLAGPSGLSPARSVKLSATSPSTPRRTISLHVTGTGAPLASSSAYAASPSGSLSTKSPRQQQQRSLTAAHLAALPPRTPTGGPSYVRDPSGSPLSSLAPTPQKPRSRASTLWTDDRTPGTVGPDGRTVVHRFELVLPVWSGPARGAPSPKQVVRRRPRFGKSGAGEVRRAREAPTSEWDAFMAEEGEGESSDDSDSGDGDQRAGTPSPAKRARRRAPASSSESSSGASSSSESELDSDAEELRAMLARAKAKREAGEAAASTAETSPFAAAPGAAGSAAGAPKKLAAEEDEEEDELAPLGSARRSTRVKHATQHYNPSGKRSTSSATPVHNDAGSSAPKRRSAAKDALGLLKAAPGARGSDLTFDKILREKQARERKGHGRDWYDRMKAQLGLDSDAEDGDEDLDARSDTSDTSDLADPSSLSKPLSASRVALALAAAGDSDDDLPAPGSVAAKGASKQAKAVERVLQEEHDAARKRRDAEGETREERKERTVWSEKEVWVARLDVTAWTGEGWKGRVARALKDGLADASTFPSPITLLSRLSRPDPSSVEDYCAVSQWLLSAICHPSTPSGLADRLIALVHRTALHASRSTSAPSPLSADQLVTALVRLGASPTLLNKGVGPGANGDASESDVMDFDGDIQSGSEGSDVVVVGREDRHELVARWCKVVQALGGVSLLLTEHDAAQLVVVCIRLSLDPHSSTSRSAFEWTLRVLLGALSGIPHALKAVFCELVQHYRSSRSRLQLAVLQTLPHDSPANKDLRRWLAWSFLAAPAAVDDALANPPNFSDSTLSPLLTLLNSPHSTSAFRLLSNSDSDPSPAKDVELAYQTRLLVLALSSLDDPLIAHSSRIESRATLESLIDRLQRLDARIRADVRKGLMVERLVAKNLLTALAHSLTYQLRTARGQKGGFGLSEEDEGAIASEERESKRVKLDEGQTTLSFGPAPPKQSLVVPAPDAEEVTEVQRCRRELDNFPPFGNRSGTGAAKRWGEREKAKARLAAGEAAEAAAAASASASTTGAESPSTSDQEIEDELLRSL